MAGFDFEVHTSNSGDLLMRRMLAGTQQFSRKRGLVWRYRHIETGYSVTVGGPLPSMQAFAVALGLYLIAFADGAENPKRPSARRRVGTRLSTAYADGLGAMTERILDALKDERRR